MAFRRKLIEIQKKPMNVQLSLADFYRINLEKNYEVGISTPISNNTPNSSKIAKKQTSVQTSISTNANISSIETSSKILLPGTPQESIPSGGLNKTIGKARNSQEIAKPPQQEANKTPKKLIESSAQASSAIHSANWNRTFSNPMDSPEIVKQQKEERYNKSVASLDALSNLKQVLQSPVVQAPTMTGDRYVDRRNNSLEMNNDYNPPTIKQTIIINPNYINPRTNMKRKLELPINQPDVGDSTFFTGISKPFNNSAISQPSQESVNAEWANEFLNRCSERKNEYRGGYWTDEYGLLKPQQQLNQIAKPYQGLSHLLYCRQISVQT